VDPVRGPLLLRKSFSAVNGTRDLQICSQELWPLDHRGGFLMLSRHGVIEGIILAFGRTVAPAFSRRLPNAASEFEPGTIHLGYIVDKATLGQVFSGYFDFLC
jgi:hypothetical protein